MLIEYKGGNFILRISTGICWLCRTGEGGEKPSFPSFVPAIADSFFRRQSTRDRRKAVRGSNRVLLDNKEGRFSKPETIHMDMDTEETTGPIVRSWVSVARWSEPVNIRSAESTYPAKEAYIPCAIRSPSAPLFSKDPSSSRKQ